MSKKRVKDNSRDYWQYMKNTKKMKESTHNQIWVGNFSEEIFKTS